MSGPSEFLASMAGETMPGEAVPLRDPVKASLEMYNAFWLDELERMEVEHRRRPSTAPSLYGR